MLPNGGPLRLHSPLTGWILWTALAASCCAAEGPVNPFGPRKAARSDAEPGRLELSDGTRHKGKLYLTRDKRLEVFDIKQEKWFKLHLRQLESITFSIESEKREDEWRWKEGGSDVKVLTGRFYYDRKYVVTVKTRDGETITGHTRGTVIYVKPEEGRAVRFIIRKDQRGDWGKKPKEIIYIKSIVFGEEAAKSEDAADKKAR